MLGQPVGSVSEQDRGQRGESSSKGRVKDADNECGHNDGSKRFLEDDQQRHGEGDEYLQIPGRAIVADPSFWPLLGPRTWSYTVFLEGPSYGRNSRPPP